MKTYEEQYYSAIELAASHRISLPCMANQTWLEDPKRLLFMLSRYKQVGVLLREMENVLELGCGDGFGTSIVAQYVKVLLALDADPLLINEARKYSSRTNIEYNIFNFLEPQTFPGEHKRFNGIYALDVFEHLQPSYSHAFGKLVVSHLAYDGTFICGIPSLESQPYASERSRAGHVNCLSASDFLNFWKQYFGTVQILSMNDEVLHTGFWPMSHYVLALCNYPK